MSAATTNTTVPARTTRTATTTRTHSRLLRLHVVLLLTFAVFTWLALTVVVAVRKGEQRRATFNGSGQYVR